MLLAKLVQEVLRALDGTGDELWIEHHIQSKDTEMSLGLLVTAVDFNGIAECLEGVERKANRKKDLQKWKRIREPNPIAQHADVGIEEIEVLEDDEHAHICDNAHH